MVGINGLASKSVLLFIIVIVVVIVTIFLLLCDGSIIRSHACGS